MRGWGILLLILGIGAFILPFFGIQFMLIGIFGEAQFIVAIIVALIGVGLLVFSFLRAPPKE